ncbi:endonuclease domain-containing protein [Mucilaginibacter sp.]
MPKIIPYNPALKPLARQLRNSMTRGEALLWNELKTDKMLGFDFDRQRCTDNYIVDFYCKDLMLAIEVDGLSHYAEEAYQEDIIRQARIETFGISVLRFTERQVVYDRLNVLMAIEGKMIELIKERPEVILPKGFDRSLLE